MDCNGCEFHPDLYYDDEYQVWLRREPGDILTVGMTDLSQAIAGKILHVRVRRPGSRRPPGKPVATIESGKWAGPVPNFVDCTILEINEAVMATPALLNQDPFGAWIARVAVHEPLDAALRRFVTGEAARAGYCARAERDDIHCGRE
ncbi:glycine cleavage system protein H [Ectothiorhodospira lacustris]|uniref:glycine cleavage system protein H n=1 Tax=Ectothiorhodospira lacustris TaxID=2899127 RepID=UPI001EE88A13|nr:glycine cleavage system protein H [Ectothiorhodospira lacustris]MCG5499572.1 glycine cleavage system protein H [Ectothiorhodospira lacustris]MCG5508734.1 glycine cleavage system protein H [Ectothiorhodospira lacustris]MCG5520525.1 glycine cleavage system protein H [Ectothiorhodospira lacustris]